MDSRPGFLIVTWGPNKGTVIPLQTGQRMWIGRRNEAFAQTDSRMSRIHFRLKPHRDSWVLEDQRSSNGTYLNGKPIQGPHTLDDGDLIQAGRTLIAFCRIEPALLVNAANPDHPHHEDVTAPEATQKSEFWPRMFRRRRAAASPTAAEPGGPGHDSSAEPSSRAPSDTPHDRPTDLETSAPDATAPQAASSDDAAPDDGWRQALRSEIIQRDQEPDAAPDAEETDESQDAADRMPGSATPPAEGADSAGASKARKRPKQGRPLESDDDFHSTILGTDEQLSMVLKEDDD